MNDSPSNAAARAARALRSRAAVAGIALGATLAACTGATPVDVPAALAPPAGQTLAMTLAAWGVQIYECRPDARGGSGPQWALVAPDAELQDTAGRTVGHHGAGPHWRAGDGSTLIGTVRQRVDAPAPQAVPWLLLATEAQGPRGLFSPVRSIQRIHTAGGVAPAFGCDGDTLGRVLKVPYRAQYRLFTAG